MSRDVQGGAGRWREVQCPVQSRELVAPPVRRQPVSSCAQGGLLAGAATSGAATAGAATAGDGNKPDTAGEQDGQTQKEIIPLPK